ncbi:GspMb/PilO family protein [Pelomonas sp. KK5]|uniref:GspMb/PilO family protein n=1 Tax=Pelomonas sp. KK5 TaxID=1855730 RepID=UPI00097C3E08|nr:GspMb/PilO family protein [Pelomonas sp. KK5]
MKWPDEQFKRQLRSLGWPGLLGALALAGALALGLAARGWDREATGLQARADSLRRTAAVRNDTITEAAATPAEWLRRLPPAAERQQRLADLLEIGLRLGLTPQRTEHRLSVDSAAGLERLRVTMPLTGGYAQLRHFIEAALEHDPALSLDSLKLRRSTPQAAELEAELVWSLHGRSETP